MATQKGNRGTKSQGSVDLSSRFRSSLGNGANVADNEKRDSVPWALLITLLAVLITFFIVMPVMGYMYIDLMNLRDAAKIEIRKMKELRRDVLVDRQKGE